MKLEIHYTPDGDWAGLYRDGQLVRVGESYRTEEEAFELAGVTVVRESVFMLGQNKREGAASTIEQVEKYRQARDAKLAAAASCREQAQQLLAEAEALENEARR